MTTEILTIPSKINGGTEMSQLLPKLFNSHADILPGEILLDLSALHFVSPSGVVLLTNLIAWFRNRNIRVSYSTGQKLTSGAVYLDDCGFFALNWGNPIRQDARLRSTSFEISLVKQENSYAFLQNQLLPWMHYATGKSEASLLPIKTCMLEIFNNITDHTTSDIGCMFAQFFPMPNELCFAFADSGVGIPGNVNELFPSLDGPEAIIKATEEGFTTRSTPRNQGIGLKLLLDTIVKSEMSGTVTICSLNGIVRFSNLGGQIVHTILQRGGYSPGTCFEVRIPVSRIPWTEDESEDLTW